VITGLTAADARERIRRDRCMWFAPASIVLARYWKDDHSPIRILYGMMGFEPMIVD